MEIVATPLLSGDCIQQADVPTFSFGIQALAPDGRTVAVFGTDFIGNVQQVKVVDSFSRVTSRTTSVEDFSRRDAVFAPDGTLFLRTEALWSLAVDAKVPTRLRSIGSTGTQVSVDPASGDVYLGDRRFDPGVSGSVFDLPAFPGLPNDMGEISQLAFSPSGAVIAAVGPDQVRVFDRIDMSERGRRSIDATDIVGPTVGFSDENRMWILASRDFGKDLLELEVDNLDAVSAPVRAAPTRSTLSVQGEFLLVGNALLHCPRN